MNYLICTFLTFLSYSIFGQVSASEKKTIMKIVGEDFIEMRPSANYSFDLGHPAISVDTSIFVVGDTTGIHIKNELLRFRDSSLQLIENAEFLTLVKPSPTTISEYQAFKNYVRDSIARLKLIHGLDDDEEAAKFVNWPKTLEKGQKISKFASERYNDLVQYGINWEQKLSFTNDANVTILWDMYIPVRERFRKQRIFDERKLEYQPANWSIFDATCVWDDYFLWARYAQHDDDELGVLSQIYPQIADENPVVGVLGTQAKAFCHWKQINLQKEFNRAGLPYEVVVTLPAVDQLDRFETNDQFIVASRDYTEQWRISVQDYVEFTNHVNDSLLRSYLVVNLPIDEEATEFLVAPRIYFSEDHLEYFEVDPSDRYRNRDLFPLDYNRKIRMNNSYVRASVDKFYASNREEFYVYSTMRTRARAQAPRMTLQEETGLYTSIDSEECEKMYRDSILERRLVYSYRRDPMGTYNAGVQRIWRLDKFAKTHGIEVNVDSMPEDLDACIPSLTYEQALAFYNWKYQIDKFNPKKQDWQDFVYPSEEQFQAIQRGESIVIPAHKLDYPTPLFRYVVHVFPK